MPAWLLPTLKAILPHVGTIVSAAAPVFTKRSSEATPNQLQVLQQQITELQVAVSANDTHIKALAQQLQAAIAALETGAATLERRQRQSVTVIFVGIGLALCALGTALFVVVVR